MEKNCFLFSLKVEKIIILVCKTSIIYFSFSSLNRSYYNCTLSLSVEFSPINKLFQLFFSLYVWRNPHLSELNKCQLLCLCTCNLQSSHTHFFFKGYLDKSRHWWVSKHPSSVLMKLVLFSIYYYLQLCCLAYIIICSCVVETFDIHLSYSASVGWYFPHIMSILHFSQHASKLLFVFPYGFW